MSMIIAFVIWIIVTAILAVTAYVGIPLLAQKNLFFTNVPEGKIKVIMKGGRAHCFIASIKDRLIDPKTGEIYSASTSQPRGFWDEMFGIKFMGWPSIYKVYTYEFHWNKYVTDQTGKHKMVHKDAPTDMLYFRAPYVIEIPNLETKDRRQVTLLVQFVTETTDAKLALFSTPNWLAIVESAVIAALRDYVASKDFDTILNEPKELGGDFVSSVSVIDKNGIGNQPLGLTVGQKLQSINLLSIEPDDKDAVKAMNAKKTAKDNADAKVEEARGKEAEKMVDVRVKQANLEATVNALGQNNDQIGIVEIARAISETKATNLVVGSGVIPSFDMSAKKGKKSEGEVE